MEKMLAGVREARPDELEACAKLWHAMRTELDAVPRGLHSNWADRFVEYVERRSRHGEVRFFIAQADASIVGTSMGLLLDGWPAPLFERVTTGYIFSVYVIPGYRRRGIARALTRATVAWLRSAGCSVIRLRASDDGRRLYEALGFVPSLEMELRGE